MRKVNSHTALRSGNSLCSVLIQCYICSLGGKTIKNILAIVVICMNMTVKYLAEDRREERAVKKSITQLEGTKAF